MSFTRKHVPSPDTGEILALSQYLSYRAERSGERNPISSFHRSPSIRNTPDFHSPQSGYVRICQVRAYPLPPHISPPIPARGLPKHPLSRSRERARACPVLDTGVRVTTSVLRGESPTAMRCSLLSLHNVRICQDMSGYSLPPLSAPALTLRALRGESPPSPAMPVRPQLSMQQNATECNKIREILPTLTFVEGKTRMNAIVRKPRCLRLTNLTYPHKLPPKSIDPRGELGQARLRGPKERDDPTT